MKTIEPLQPSADDREFVAMRALTRETDDLPDRVINAFRLPARLVVETPNWPISTWLMRYN